MTDMIITTNNIPTYQNKSLQAATNKVFKIGETIRRCAFETAFIMAQVDETECYKDDGFNSVHDWAMKTFGFKKSASYTLLRVGKEYTRAIPDAKGRVKGYGSNLIPENATEDFTTTQIEKMLPGGHDLAVELVESEEITPDMTCKQIEKVIKSHTTEDETEVGENETDVEDEIESGIESDNGVDLVYNANVENDGSGVTITLASGDKFRIPGLMWNDFRIN